MDHTSFLDEWSLGALILAISHHQSLMDDSVRSLVSLQLSQRREVFTISTNFQIESPVVRFETSDPFFAIAFIVAPPPSSTMAADGGSLDFSSSKVFPFEKPRPYHVQDHTDL